MVRIVLFMTVLCIATLISTSSGAAELTSAPLSAVTPNSCSCYVMSVSNKTHELTVEHLDRSGEVFASNDVTIAPGFAIERSFGCGINNPNYCRVSGKFPRKKLRGVYCVTASTTEGICVPLE